LIWNAYLNTTGFFSNRSATSFISNVEQQFTNNGYDLSAPWNAPVKKSGTSNPYLPLSVSCQAHVQNKGWLDYAADGQTAGTTGQSLRLEALKIRLENAPENASIEYHVFVDGPGWTPWAVNDTVSGTTGESRQVEAVEIRLSHLPGYSVSYRAHVQKKGWLDWVADGQAAGSPGSGLRLEAVEIKVMEKK
jgi:uncharacterized protein YjdB